MLGKQLAYWLTIPMSVALTSWVVFGRGFFGVIGWMFVLLLPVGVFMLVALGATAGLAIRQHRPADGHLTTPQFACLIGLWVALAGVGLFVTDIDDVQPAPASAFTRMVGGVGPETSSLACQLCAVAALLCYALLFVMLVNGQAGRTERRALASRPP